MGPDTRVSARADILSERQTVAPENSALIGIWNAWSIDPRSPGDYQGRKAGAPSERSGPDGESIPDGGFHRWLVSTADDDDVSDLGFVSNQLSGDSVPLVNAVGSEPNSAPVLAAKIPLIDSDGNIDGQYAWGVFDEGQKAALNSFPDSRQKRTTLESVALQDGLNWDAIEDWKGISALDEAKQRKLLSLATVGFGGVAQPDDFWHDLTPGSSAVLADVTRGGLKTDLSLLFSRTELPEDYELQHVYSRDEKPLVDVPELDGHAYQFPSPDPRWSLLHKFHRVPEEVFGGEADSPRISFNASQSGSTIPFRPNGFTGDADYHHDLKLAPVIAKAQFIFSMAFGSSGGLRNIQQRMVQDRVTDWKYIANAQIVIEPIITLWNPYDVPMDVSEFRIFLYRMPLALQIQSSSPYFRRKAGYENTPTDFVSVLAGDAASNSTNIGYPLNIAPPAGKTST